MAAWLHSQLCGGCESVDRWRGGLVVMAVYGCSRGRCVSWAQRPATQLGLRLLARLHLVDNNSEDMQRVTHGCVQCAMRLKENISQRCPLLLPPQCFRWKPGRRAWENATKYTNYKFCCALHSCSHIHGLTQCLWRETEKDIEMTWLKQFWL